MYKKIIAIVTVVLCILLFGAFSSQGKLVKVTVSDGTIVGRLMAASDNRVVIFVAGSGPTDMNGNSDFVQGDNDSFLQLAKELHKQGISTFRYDKRSAGLSKPLFRVSPDVVIADFASDLVGVINEMKQEGYEEIILLGHSQGSLVSILAAQQTDVHAVISVSGSGRNIGDNLIEQYSRDPELHVAHIEVIRSLMEGDYTEGAEETDPLFAMEKQRFLMDWMRYDPAEDIGQLDVPVLIVQGSEDFQTGMSDSSKLHSSAKNSSLAVIQGMNHVMKAVIDEEENVLSYQDPSFALSTELVQVIGDYLSTYDR